jgi:hypothetical protein
MVPMQHRSLFRLSVFMAAFGLIVSSLGVSAQQDTSRRGRKYKSPPPTARIAVTVLRDVNGKPIEKDKGNMELKTNEDGKTIIDVLPIGDVVRLQIIAKGFQTYGEDYKVDKAEMAIEIRMKRPGEQYSIYKKHDESEVGGKSPDADKTAAPATAPAPSPDATKQPDAQPGQPQSK